MNYNEYDHIELTDEELKIILYNAKKIKAGKIAEAEYWKKVKETSEVKVMNYNETFDYYIKKAQKTITDFVLNEQNKEIFSKLCEYFSSDEKKGIIISGPVGCGKTTLMNLFSENQKRSYRVVSCRQVSYDFSNFGVEAISEYSKNIQTSANRFQQREYGFCFDDLGTESDAKHFGNQSNVMQDILLNRYDKLQKGSTHITTNLSAIEIKEIYGDRAASRMREMFHIIQFEPTAKDLRK